jgi:enterochelin esterase-like enzyme
MKKSSILPILFTIVICMLGSCSKTTQESQFNEFEINCKDGTVRTGAIYIPKGTSDKDKLPVVFMGDGLVFKETKFKQMMDSLIDYGCINPVVVACSYENKKQIQGYNLAYRNAEYVETLAKNDNTLAELFNNHYNYFINEFIPYVDKNAPVSQSKSDRIYFGTSNSADFGITLSFRNQKLFNEYWCFSPVYSDIHDYEPLSTDISYSICWGAKEEVGIFDYFPNLLKDIRKRGGKINSWVFGGGHDRDWWRYWFKQELMRRFPYSND